MLLLVLPTRYLLRFWHLIRSWLVFASCLDVNNKVQVRAFTPRRCSITTKFTLWLTHCPELFQIRLLLLFRIESFELDWVFQCLSALFIDIKHGYSLFLGARNGHIDRATVTIDGSWSRFHTLINKVVFGHLEVSMIMLHCTQSHDLLVYHENADNTVSLILPFYFSGLPHIIHPFNQICHSIVSYFEWFRP